MKKHYNQTKAPSPLTQTQHDLLEEMNKFHYEI